MKTFWLACEVVVVCWWLYGLWMWRFDWPNTPSSHATFALGSVFLVGSFLMLEHLRRET